MKTCFRFIYILLFVLEINAASIAGKSITENDCLFDVDGNAIESLQAISKLSAIKHDGTLDSIVKATQAVQPVGWMRKPGQSRWDMTDLYADQKEKFLPLFKQINYLQTIKPKLAQYDYALILGGKFEEMLKRFQYFIELCNSGIKFGQIIVLCGQQQIHENDLISAMKFNPRATLPKTESDMARFIYKSIMVKEAIKLIPILFTETPEKIIDSGKKIQPNTIDTINTWLKLNPKPGNCLVFSSQPFVQHQHAGLLSAFDKNFNIETIGVGVEGEISVSLILDTLARQLYQLRALKLKKG